MFARNLKIFLKRNTYRIEHYRLKSFFNLKNNRFDCFLSKSLISKTMFQFFYRTCSVLRYLLRNKVDIHSIDFNLTTKCNLRCKDCASLMPYYDNENQWTIDFETFKKDLDKLLLSVNRIYRLKLIGGEPLLVKDLEKILDYACSKDKVASVIITTNSTLVPSDELCSILKKYNKKSLVELSDYSTVVPNLKYQEIEEKLKSYNIYYFISNYAWFECGKIQKRNKTINELIETYQNCFQQPCLAYFDGKIYNCTKAAAINRLTDYSFEPDSIVNVRENDSSKIEIRNFYSKNYFDVCCYCPNRTEQSIGRGVQTEEPLKID